MCERGGAEEGLGKGCGGGIRENEGQGQHLGQSKMHHMVLLPQAACL